MAGITGGTPEVAVGEPITFGTNDDYEAYHDPITDRLIIRDTANDTKAYVRPETNDRMGYKGAFLRSLINGEPLADDGRLYSTVEAAEQAAGGWVFVPPGTFTGTPSITTDGLTLIGAGYGTVLDGGTTSHGLSVEADNVTVRNLRMETTAGQGNNLDALSSVGDIYDLSVIGCWVTASGRHGLGIIDCTRPVVVGCQISGVDDTGIEPGGSAVVVGNWVSGVGTFGIRLSGSTPEPGDHICVGNIIRNPGNDGIHVTSSRSQADDSVVGFNRIASAGDDGIDIRATDCIIFNNRISDSYTSDINDKGTGTTLDANLTGAAN